MLQAGDGVDRQAVEIGTPSIADHRGAGGKLLRHQFGNGGRDDEFCVRTFQRSQGFGIEMIAVNVGDDDQIGCAENLRLAGKK
jgi:hypothetical protein